MCLILFLRNLLIKNYCIYSLDRVCIPTSDPNYEIVVLPAMKSYDGNLGKANFKQEFFGSFVYENNKLLDLYRTLDAKLMQQLYLHLLHLLQMHQGLVSGFIRNSISKIYVFGSFTLLFVFQLLLSIYSWSYLSKVLSWKCCL